MMNVINGVSTLIIPIVILFVVADGLVHKVNVYEAFIDGATDGIKITAGIVPTLIGLFLAVRVFDDSGVLDLITGCLMPLAGALHAPASVLPVMITKLFSSGSATSLMLQIFEASGPDSTPGLMSATMLSSTESVFYTMSVFLMAAGVTKSRYTLPGALISVAAGVAVSIILANLLS